MKKEPARRARVRTGPARGSDAVHLWAQAVENSVELIAMTGRDGRFLLANRAFVTALGRRKEDVIGRHFSLALGAVNPPALVQEIGTKAYADEGWKGECLFARGDGTTMPILLSVGPVKGADGTVIGSFGVAQDIGERRRIEDALRETEEQFRQLAENIREVFFSLSPHPVRMMYISPAYEEIWGRSRQALYAQPADWIASTHPDDRERVSAVFAQCLLGVPTDMEYRLVRPDGGVRWIHARSFPVRDATGTLQRIVGIAEDVTTRLEERAALREAHDRLDRSLQTAEREARMAVRLTEMVDILQSCQTLEEAYRILGDTLPNLLAADAGALCLTSPSRNTVETVVTWGAVASDPTFAPEECWALRRGKIHVASDPDSPLRCRHVHASAAGGHVCVPLAAQGETLGVLCLAGPRADEAISGQSAEAQLTELGRRAIAVGERMSLALANLRLREVLRRQSIRDPLTGLFNRRYMEESLERELRRAARHEQPLAVLMLDIDHFKRFNDTFGHQAGDTLLRALGEFLLARTRGEDVACRYGGEEFVIVLSGSGLDGATLWADELRRALPQLVVPHGGQVLGKVTASVGVAVFPDHGQTADVLLQAADQALYRAKTDGRDRVVVA
jgi:diguanylate cyclase (GGDEF)-like protein/PAS domain S-box-containing protein